MVKERAKVLVIESEADLLTGQTVAELVGNVETVFEFVYADRLSAGLARLDVGDITLVVLDFSLPQSEDLAAVIKAQMRTAHLPIIVLTDHADHEAMRRAITAGAHNCLNKATLDQATLQRALVQALEAKETGMATIASKNGVAAAVTTNGQVANSLSPNGVTVGTNGAINGAQATANGVHVANGPNGNGSLSSSPSLKPKREPIIREPMQSTESPISETKSDTANAAEMRYRTLLDCARDAIILTDLQDRVTLWSKGAERIYGWTTTEAQMKPLHLLLHQPGAATKYEDARKRTFEFNEWSGETKQRTRDEREITVESRWTLVRNDKGEPESFLVINTDITDRKRIESHLLRAQRMDSIGALAAGIAHDLNNVLAPILMALRPLQQQFPDEASQRWISLIQKSAERGKDLINQVLTFAKGTTGEQAALQVTHIIKDVARILKETLPRNIEIVTKLPEDAPYVIGDTTQLHQMLMNFSLNARDAMVQGGRLSLELESLVLSEQDVLTKAGATPGRFVRVTISDTGTGIPAELVDRIFDPFFTTKEHGKGTGLGLSIAMGIARSHGGFIDVQTEVGKGSQFKIYLPASAATAPTKLAAAPGTLPNGNGELILVVDDEEALREVVQATLEAAGYDVMTAEDGLQALKLYEENKSEISAVLTDLMMPNMDGVTAIRKMREMNPHVQVIVTTGVKLSGQHNEASKLGFGTFLAKPYTPEDLLGSLAKLLKKEA